MAELKHQLPSLMSGIWLVAGLIVGILHAGMIWRSSRRLTAWTPVPGMFRLLGVAAVLLASAMAGFIVTSATGWMIGFVVSAVRLSALGAGRSADIRNIQRSE